MGVLLTAGVMLLPSVLNNVYTEKAIANYSNSSSITAENNAQLDKSVRHAIYANNFNNTNPNVPMLNDGIQFSSKYTVINKETNQVESSGLSYEKPWDVLYKAIPLTYANGDVVDTKLYSELTSISKTTNTSNEVKQIDQEITFAKSGDVQIDASRVSGNIISGDFDDTKMEVKYKYNNTFYTFQELNALSGFSCSDVTAVSFKGNLDPSKSITRLFKTKTGNEDPTPQSVVFVFPVAVYVFGVHSVVAAVNVGAGANLWVRVSIKFGVYGYSVKKQDERVKNIAYTLFPDLKNIDNLLNEFFDNNEKIELMKYILTESSKKLKSELRNNDEYFKGIERWGLI